MNPRLRRRLRKLKNPRCLLPEPLDRFFTHDIMPGWCAFYDSAPDLRIFTYDNDGQPYLYPAEHHRYSPMPYEAKKFDLCYLLTQALDTVPFLDGLPPDLTFGASGFHVKGLEQRYKDKFQFELDSQVRFAFDDTKARHFSISQLFAMWPETSAGLISYDWRKEGIMMGAGIYTANLLKYRVTT